MRRIRPAAVLVIGILNIVFGGLGMLCLFCATGSAVGLRFVNIPGPNGENMYTPMFDILDREIPNLFTIQFWMGIASMALACMFLIGGIGLLRMRRWGRILSVIGCIGIVIIQTVSIIWTIMVVNPVMERAIKTVHDDMAKGMPPNAQAQVTEVEERSLYTDQETGNLFAVAKLVLIIYCMTIIVMLFRSSVSAAFAPNRGLT